MRAGKADAKAVVMAWGRTPRTGNQRLNAVRSRLIRDADPMGHRAKPEPDVTARPDESTGRVGRNDPCPCGSGVKAKRCGCGLVGAWV